MKILRYFLFALASIYWVGLFVLTHLPAIPAIGPRMSDKTAHFVAYFVLAGSLYLTWVVANPRRRMAPLIVYGIILAYAGFDELTQPLVGRACELGDWFADAAGAASAVLILWAVRAAVELWIRRVPRGGFEPVITASSESS